MSDEIKPAMTPEEWGPNIDKVGVSSELAADLAEHRPHALAALALHGQPFGFTWEDVDALQIAVDGYQRRVRASGENAEWEGFAGLRSLADRIAALLPPREP